jgi:ribonuclease HI
VVVKGKVHIARDLGHGTSNDAEWLALIEAMRLALSLEEPDYILIGDSAVVIGQAKGLAKCRSQALQTHLDRFHQLVAGGPRPRIRQIKRSQNLAGIVLAKSHA